jgi:hypothetical protein
MGQIIEGFFDFIQEFSNWKWLPPILAITGYIANFYYLFSQKQTLHNANMYGLYVVTISLVPALLSVWSLSELF